MLSIETITAVLDLHTRIGGYLEKLPIAKEVLGGYFSWLKYQICGSVFIICLQMRGEFTNSISEHHDLYNEECHAYGRDSGEDGVL